MPKNGYFDFAIQPTLVMIQPKEREGVQKG